MRPTTFCVVLILGLGLTLSVAFPSMSIVQMMILFYIASRMNSVLFSSDKNEKIVGFWLSL